MSQSQTLARQAASGRPLEPFVPPARHRRFANWRAAIVPLLFAMFLSAGVLKNAEFFRSIPIDLTFALAVAIAVVTAFRWVRNGFAVPWETWALAGLFGSFLAATVGTPLSEYGQEKALFLFTLTALAAAAPLILFRSPAEVRQCLVAFASVGLFVAAAALEWTDPARNLRAGAFGGSPIGTARIAGVALVLLAAGLMWRSVRWPVGLVGSAVAGAAMVASGSRGPMVAAGFAVVVILLLSTRSSAGAVRGLTFAATLVLAVALGLSASPDRIDIRFSQFLAGDVQRSSAPRLAMLQVSLSSIATTPEGLGWGRYETIHPFVEVTRTYPHNLVAEVAVEGGWVPALLLLALFALAAHRLLRMPPSAERTALLGLLAFLGMSAMFSDDVNGNRALFATLAMALAFTRARLRTAHQEAEGSNLSGISDA